MTQPRTQKGVPAGGQFAATEHAEATGSLDDLPAPLPALSLSTNNRSIMHFLDNWRDGPDPFDMEAPYQRESVWDENQRRNLIKSLLMGLPAGAVTIAALPGDRAKYMRVVDGKQRIEAMRGFVNDEFTIPGHWLPPADLNDPADRARDVCHSDLSERGKRGFSNATIGCIDFDSHTEWTGDANGKWHTRHRTEDEMIAAEAELYNLINFGGVPQTEEDQARAARVAAEYRANDSAPQVPAT